LAGFGSFLLAKVTSVALAGLLQVTLMFHLPAHGGVPMILNGVVCPINVQYGKCHSLAFTRTLVLQYSVEL